MNKVANNIKNTVKEFIEDLSSVLEGKLSSDLVIVNFFFQKLSADDTAQHVVKHVLPYKEKIRQRDMNFFIESKRTIFAGLDDQKIDDLSKIVRKLPKDDLDVVWSYFDMLVELSEKYKKID